MSRRVLALLVAGLAAISLAACSSSALKLASASPTTPYQGTAGQPAINGGGADFGVAPDLSMPIVIAAPKLSSSHTYSLPELIDIAQLSNPVTRAAWQRAREAAAAAGAVEATYLPILTADVLAGYAVTSNTVPGINTPLVTVNSGTVTTSGMQVSPALAVKWLLFDFGGRDAARASAQQLSFAADVTFNAAHQKLIFDVSNAFFQFSAARSQTRINRESLDNAKVVLSAAEARLGQGIATTMEVAQAKQQVAQAEFDLTQATGRERNTYHYLLESMGISPTTKINVQDISGRALPRVVPTDLDNLIVASLQRRPDVQAAFARVKANKEGIAAARAEFMPKVALTGTVNQTIGHYSVDDSSFGTLASVDVNQPNAAVLVGLSLPLFDGGLRDARMQAAVAQSAASEQEFAQLQNLAAREIVVGYDVLRTSLSGYAAATALVNAAQTNYDAALDYYKNGLGTLADISIAQTGLLKAQYARAQARSDSLSAAATMAFATGQLTNAGVP
ncbi:TolC family protein [Devosia sp. 2618]|uniref:TolC family protein n=1 Tax=Devosia sp. 2618 TaxID=3156454 RepID=UPI00339A43A4